MTPGAGTAHVVGRVACRRMRAGRRPVCGTASVIRASQVAPLRLRAVECCFASVIRASQVAPLRLRRLNAVLWWLVCGVARGGAIHDARCRNGTCGRSRCVSADAGGAVVGLSFCGGWFVASPVGAPLVTPGAGTAHVVGRVVRRWMWAGRRLIVVLWRPVCGTASVIRASQVAPLRLRRLVCSFSSVGLRRSPWGRHS